MPLLPFTRQHPPAEPPATRALSPARAALRENFESYASQLRHLEILAEPQRALGAAEKRLAEVRSVLTAREALEAQRLRDWSQNPSTPMPHSLADERAAAMAEVEAAQAEHDAAAKVWSAVEGTWRSEETKLHAITLARPNLVRDVLLETAREIAERRRQAFTMLATTGGALEALIETFRRLDDGEGATEMQSIIKGGDRNDERAFHDAQIRHGMKVRDAFMTLRQQLMLDPHAAIDIKGDAA